MAFGLHGGYVVFVLIVEELTFCPNGFAVFIVADECVALYEMDIHHFVWLDGFQDIQDFFAVMTRCQYVGREGGDGVVSFVSDIVDIKIVVKPTLSRP